MLWVLVFVLPLLSIGHAPSPPAPLPPCKTCRRPTWSWATVGHMSFTHTCNVSGPWSDEALDILQKFPMVNVERFMGQHQRCFARHRDQWGAPGCWLNATQGSPACNTWVDHGPPAGPHVWLWSSAGLPGCNCTVEEAPIGQTPDARGLYVEDHAIAALRQIKQRNANVSTILYHDSARMWTGDQISSAGRIGTQTARHWNPTVFRADNTVVNEHRDWLLKNTSDQYVWDHYANNHIFDLSHPQMQRFWADVCLNATSSGWVDGCFADAASMGGVNPAAPGQPASVGVQGVMDTWHVSRSKAEEWVNGHQQALAALTAALGRGILVANGGWNDGWRGGTLASGFMLEVFEPTRAQIAVIEAAASAGLVNQVHANMYGRRFADVRDALAGFLLGTGPYQYFSGPWQWQINQTCADPLGIVDIRRRWPLEFDKALGEAVGLARYDRASNTSTRSFGSGTIVSFNFTARQGTIRWADGHVTRGPGCSSEAEACMFCYPPLYEDGSLEDATGGCVWV